MNSKIILILLIACFSFNAFSQKNSDFTISLKGYDKNGISTAIGKGKFLPGEFEFTVNTKDMFGFNKYVWEVKSPNGDKKISYETVVPNQNESKFKIQSLSEGDYTVRIMKPTLDYDPFSSNNEHKDFFKDQIYDTLAIGKFNIVPDGLYFCSDVGKNDMEVTIGDNQSCNKTYILYNNLGESISKAYLIIYEGAYLPNLKVYGIYDLNNVKKGINNLGEYKFPCEGKNYFVFITTDKKDAPVRMAKNSFQRQLYIH